MTRRERLERKVELRREWAEKRLAKAESSYARSNALVEHIPFGQPILIGHHSERTHRNTITKAQNAMRAAAESTTMAHHHESKAKGLESQLENTVFSDDPDAIEQLQSKIEAGERQRDVMKAANKIVRAKPKNELTEAKLAALKAIGINEANGRRLFEPDFCGRFGFPDYSITNLGANLRRMRDRIAQIKTRNARQEMSEQAEEGVLVEGGVYVRITFAEKPDRDILNDLRGANFYWSNGSWNGLREAIPDSVRELAKIDYRIGSLQWWALDRSCSGQPCKLFIRCGKAYFWPVGFASAYVADVDNGRWMQHTQLGDGAWKLVTLTEDQKANFKAAARDCYCYNGVQRCDFCTSTRTPDGAPWSSGEAFDLS